MKTISHALMKALRRGVQRCSSDALERLCGFVAGQWNGASGGFCDRAGKPDLYYTQFGLMLARALRMKTDVSAVEKFCRAHDVNSFDLVHASCFARSLLLVRPWLTWLQRRRIRRDCESALAALIRAAQTPYEQFLALTLAQDVGLPFEKKPLDAYRAADGLYANVPEAAEGGVNATASAILTELLECGGLTPLFRYERSSYRARPQRAGINGSAFRVVLQAPVRYAHTLFREVGAIAPFRKRCQATALQSAVHALAEQERGDGSFCANVSTSFPDILSTASARFALHVAGMRPRNDAKIFVEECFVEDAGGFAASPDAETPDLEYTVYGIILMGMEAEEVRS